MSHWIRQGPQSQPARYFEATFWPSMSLKRASPPKTARSKSTGPRKLLFQRLDAAASPTVFSLSWMWRLLANEIEETQIATKEPQCKRTVAPGLSPSRKIIGMPLGQLGLVNEVDDPRGARVRPAPARVA